MGQFEHMKVLHMYKRALYNLLAKRNLYCCIFFSLWPQIVRDRVRSTYLYFGGGIIFTAASAVAVARTPALMRMMTNGSWMVKCRSDIKIWKFSAEVYNKCPV